MTEPVHTSSTDGDSPDKRMATTDTVDNTTRIPRDAAPRPVARDLLDPDQA